MRVLDKIVKLAQSELPSWQADAARRLLTQGTLTTTDEEELLLMLKAKYRLLNPGETAPNPTPLQSTDIPGIGSASSQTTLLAIKNLTNVNQIPAGSALTFGENGLTIIYGDNASGKSGYARVLKKACRARDTAERIYPNVYAQAPVAPASASFILRTGASQPQEVQWVDETNAPEILTNICVFDSKCARIIIDEDNEAVYLPYGASVFQELASLLQKFKTILKKEQPQPTLSPSEDIPPTTQAGKFLASLNTNTTPEALEQATRWTSKDETTLQELKRDVAKVTAEDPSQQALRLRNLRTRVASLKAALETMEAALSTEAAATIEKKICEANAAQRAFAIASQQSPSLREEPLSGVGDNEWKLLYEAAQQYSTMVAYQHKDFPFTGPDSLCVLCMQPLSQDAKERFNRFKSFMENTTKKRLDTVTADLTTAARQLADLDFDILASYKDALDEITTRNKSCADLLKESVEKALARKMSMESAFQSRATITLPELPSPPISEIENILVSMDEDAARLDKAADPQKLVVVQTTMAELSARKKLVERKPEIAQYLCDLKMASLYDLCLKETDTTSITIKGREIVSSALTQPFQILLNTELSDLGVPLQLRLDPRGVAGQTIHKLRLDNCQLPPGAKVTDILSEGEQCVVSIASFLAELNVCAHNNPIVFDDPVSSLDHTWREKVAARLITEASHRQVIVFTHDIVFTTAIMHAAQVSNIPLSVRCVQRVGNVPGATADAIPWKAANVSQSLDALDKEVKQLSATWKSQTTEEYAQSARPLYSKMRATWEKAIEEVAFCRTVQRFDAHIRVNPEIMKTTVLDIADCKDLLAAYKKCCDITEAHSNIDATNAPVPHPDEIAKDLQTLKVWIARIKSKQKNLP